MPTGTRDALNVDFRKGHVQDDIFAEGGGYISSESIVLAVKARDPNTTAEVETATHTLGNFIAVGLVENITLAQQKNLQQLFEIGSRESYFIPGRTIIQAALNRVIFDGDSLMRALYPTAGNTIGDGRANPDYTDTDFEESSSKPGDSLPGADLWFNLASEFFNKPFTCAILFYNDSAFLKGYIVLENCYVEAHNMNVVAAQTVVTENVRIRCTRIVSVGADESQIETT